MGFRVVIRRLVVAVGSDGSVRMVLVGVISFYCFDVLRDRMRFMIEFFVLPL